jgi:hypothetical protein
MDFIEELPKSGGYNSILVVVDRLTKWAIFIPTVTTLNSSNLVELILQHVVSQHGLPSHIVSDRGSKFVSKLWRNLMERLGINLRLSTAYHPQTDGQTERINQVLEQYLRVFTSYQQDDWAKLLGQASFAYNNSLHATTQTSPFFANYGYHPRWVTELKGTLDTEVPASTTIAESIIDVHRQCSSNIVEANKKYSEQYNKGRQPTPEFQVGDQVMLSMANIKTIRPMKKLDVKQAGPYTITALVGTHACRLGLPAEAKIHDVFHVSLLRPFKSSEFPGQQVQPPNAFEIDPAGGIYEVSAVVDSRRRRGKLEYLVEWAGYEQTEDFRTWESEENVRGAEELIREFHDAYPTKPSTRFVEKRMVRRN